MADKPKSTADILASIRTKSGGPPAAKPETPPEPAPAAESPAAAVEASAPAESAPVAAAPKPAGDAPKGTSNILAAIRAQKAAAAGGDAPAAAAPAAAAPKGEAPKGTSSILANIRGGGAAKPAAAGDKPAAKAAVAKAAAPAGDKPSVQDMIRAVKAGVKAPEPGALKMPAKLPGGKPDVVVTKGAALAKGGKGAPQPRRSVFAPIVALVSTPFALAWSLMTILGGIFTLKGAQFMMPNMVLELPSKFKVGVASDFPLGTVSEKYKAARGVWIVHTDAYDGKNTIYALASVCTHLGCTPNWLEGEQKYKCPCHGSGFYISGINFEGPAPRPLERVGIRVAEDGQIEVDKSVKFQEELGQWADGKSFIELV
jgi:cytochrome b6-f complex iron-sulfur subunit